MREEIKIWWEQAKEDLDTAEKNIKIEKFYASVFFCQQAVEKALKSLYILKFSKPAGPTHSLIYLAKELKLPLKYFSLLQDLTPEFITTRYPDIAGEAPYKLYNKEKAEEYVKRAKELLKWVEDQIKKH